MSREKGKDDIVQTIPETIGEYLDDYILPYLADGTRSALEITEEVISLAQNRLNDSKDDIWLYADELYDLELIDSYFVLEQHKEPIQRYVQYVFDDWEGAEQ